MPESKTFRPQSFLSGAPTGYTSACHPKNRPMVRDERTPDRLPLRRASKPGTINTRMAGSFVTFQPYESEGRSLLIILRLILARLAESAVNWREQFVAEARQVGGEIFRAALEESDVWNSCAAQRAPDYRLKVAKILRNWFKGPPATPELLQAMEHNIQAEWESQVLDEFRRLTEEAGTEQPEQPARRTVAQRA